MSKINYVIGDATQPNTRPAIIAHICNTAGGWGRGFTGAISKRWPGPEKYYRAMKHRRLGWIGAIEVESGICVANMIAQRRYSKPGLPAIDYQALEVCLRDLVDYAMRTSSSVHMPRVGTDWAGGDWAVIEPIIERTLCASGVSVTVYDLPK